MPYALPFPDKGRTSAMSYSAADTESIAVPCLLAGPLLRKVLTAACEQLPCTSAQDATGPRSTEQQQGFSAE
jgi:hypothetical protein